MNDQNAQNDKLQIGIDFLGKQISDLDENQDALNQKLLDVTQKYDLMKQFIIKKMESNTRWRKQYHKKKKLVKRNYKKSEIP